MTEGMDRSDNNINSTFHQQDFTSKANDDDEEYFSAYDDELTEYADYAASLEDGLIESCKCLPACSSIHYDAEVSQTHLSWKEYSKARKTYSADQEKYYKFWKEILL